MVVKHKVVQIDYDHYGNLCRKLDEMAANGIILVQILQIKKVPITGKSVLPLRAECLVFQPQQQDAGAKQAD